MTECKPIPGYVGIYWIFPDGRIRNAKGQFLKPINGYVELRNCGTKERYHTDVLRYKVYGGRVFDECKNRT